MRNVRLVSLPSDGFGPLRVQRRRDFEVEGAGFFGARGDLLHAPLPVVRDASLTALKRAVSRYIRSRRDSLDRVTMLVADVAPETFVYDRAEYMAAKLNVSETMMRVIVEQPARVLIMPDQVARLLQPLLDRRRAVVVRPYARCWGPEDSIGVEIELSSRGRTVGDAMMVGDDAARLLAAAGRTGVLEAESAAELLRAGHHDVLAGQPENDWLDAKQTPYRLEEKGRFLLARDIAAFCNAKGGLIAVGMRTVKRQGEDVIGDARPIPLADVKLEQYRAVVRDWLYPRPSGVRFDVAPLTDSSDCGLLIIEIPPQPEELKPFFVKRAWFAGRLRTEHLAVPVRHAAETTYWDLGALHSLIVAGRAALATTSAAKHE